MDCSGCRYSDLVITKIGGPDEENKTPVLKCYRFPPIMIWDAEDGAWDQNDPIAAHICGEFKPVQKTSGVIGTLRKVRNEQLVRAHARRFLSGVRRILDRTSVHHQANSTQHHAEADGGKDSPAQD